MPIESPKIIAQDCITMCAEFLLARQVIAPAEISSLEDLAGKPATRCGNRQLDLSRVVKHETDNDLVKVGVSADKNVNSIMLQNTSKARSQLAHRQMIRSKVRRYLMGHRPHKFRRIVGYGLGRVFDILYKGMRSGQPTSCQDIKWGYVAGVNYRRQPDLTYRCIDRGGIYETWLTTQWTPYPSQVGADLYTSACAARLFQWMYQRTNDTKWKDAGEELNRYFNGFFNNMRQRIEFDHREFNYGPVFQAYGAKTASGFEGWTRYDPVNVFGLRLYNIGLVWNATLKNKLKLLLITAVIKRNQTKEGLISDNSRGMCVDSADITYHQYALAMLCLGNSRIRSHVIDDIIKRGIMFSLRQQLCTGEVAYYGRAANNVYHLAAFTAALFYGQRYLDMEVEEALKTALGRLSAFQREDGAWDTCMNGQPEHEMIGWHGSTAQYSALSAFLLSEALDLDTSSGHKKGSLDPAITHKEVRKHCMLKKGAVELALCCGGDKVKWGAGRYEVGYAGITALTFHKKNIWLGNERIFASTGESIVTADIQCQQVNTKTRFQNSEDGAVTITVRNNSEKHKKRYYTYKVYSDGYDVRLIGNGVVNYALPLKGNWILANREPSNSIELHGDEAFIILIDSDYTVSSEVTQVEHNTQGKGSLVILSTEASNNKLRIRFTFRGAQASHCDLISGTCQ